MLVFGANGQLGRALQRLRPQARFLSRAQADLADTDACFAAIMEGEAKAVINAAAWTAVDRAEAEEAAATAINAAAPEAMARACALRGIPFVHVSTDYVFDGSGTRPWQPGDVPAPLSAYGRSKLAGERAVRAAGGVSVVLRTAWVFSAQPPNFVTTMLRLGRERDHLRVVADQIGGPTPADDLAHACVSIAQALREDPARAGIYHFAGAPELSWAGFAHAIMQQAGLPCRIEEIASEDYPTPAPRPRNSRLDCSVTETVFGLSRPDWRVGLAGVLQHVKEQS